MNGTICTWIESKAFGFILPDGTPENGEHVFLHITDCPNRKPLKVNTRVEFVIIPWGNRTKAANIRVLPIDSSAVRS